MDHIDFISELADRPAHILMKHLISQKMAGKRAFKLHWNYNPRMKEILAREYFNGMMDKTTLCRLPQDEWDKANIDKLGLYILDQTRENKYDEEDELNWAHVGIIVSNRGSIPHRIKSEKQKQIRKNTEKDGVTAQKLVIERYWVEGYTNKILVILDAVPPHINAMMRYDRIWTTSPDIVKMMGLQCRDCGGTMEWDDNLFGLRCDACKYGKRTGSVQHPKMLFIGNICPKCDKPMKSTKTQWYHAQCKIAKENPTYTYLDAIDEVDKAKIPRHIRRKAPIITNEIDIGL